MTDVLVVGAGAWGLPTAAELAERGHRVTLVDRDGPANAWASSHGPTRVGRLAHPDRLRVRLGIRSIEAMDRLSRIAGEETFARRGILWRDDLTFDDVTAALGAEGVEYTAVEPGDVGRFFPGLRPDGRPAVWQAEAGPVLAAVALAAQLRRFTDAGGVLHTGGTVREVITTPAGFRLVGDGVDLAGERLVLAAGPGMQPLLAGLGVELTLRSELKQVVHFGTPGDVERLTGLPCLIDRSPDEDHSIYAMATPGVGYKVGSHETLRTYDVADRDRAPSAAITERLRQRVERDLTAVPPVVIDASVCSMTYSPDKRFVIDTLPGGIVVAAGDSGEGFKFSALMGLLLADLVETERPDPDLAPFGLGRF